MTWCDKIHEALSTYGPLTRSQLIEATGSTYNAIARPLYTMINTREVVRIKKRDRHGAAVYGLAGERTDPRDELVDALRASKVYASGELRLVDYGQLEPILDRIK